MLVFVEIIIPKKLFYCHASGNTSSSKLSFVTETSQEIVFSSESPSLVMTYDRILSAHAVWAVRQTKPEVSSLSLTH